MVPKVKQFAPNHLTIETNEGIFFQSYDSVICFFPNDSSRKVEIYQNWAYSKTTSKFRSKFLGESTKETQAKIDSGEYLFTSLSPDIVSS